MKVRTSLSAADVAAIVNQVSRETYAGNLKCEADRQSRTTIQLKLDARDSRGMGARRSASGRRGPWACWHAGRDVLAAIYLADPAAKVTTMLEAYGDARGFLDLFPETGNRNAGSAVAPVRLADLCDCEADGGRDLDDTARDYVAELAEIVDGAR